MSKQPNSLVITLSPDVSLHQYKGALAFIKNGFGHTFGIVSLNHIHIDMAATLTMADQFGPGYYSVDIQDAPNLDQILKQINPIIRAA